MNNSEFEDYLMEKLDIDPILIQELFVKAGNDLFKAALTLIEVHGVKKEDFGKIWGNYLGFAYVNPNNSIVNQEYIKKLDVNFILENKALPLYKFGKAVTVCTSTPTNPFIQDKLEKKLGELVSFVFCFPFDIQEYLKKNNLIK